MGGVASGIANYLDIDPAVMRILMLLFVFLPLVSEFCCTSFFGSYCLPGIAANYTGKRLFRNPDDKVISGVASSLAAYFRIQPWILRIILLSPILLNIIFGTFNGIFFFMAPGYFPQYYNCSIYRHLHSCLHYSLDGSSGSKKSTFEKMEMRGEKVDVNRIKQNVQEGMGDFKTRMQGWSEEVKTSAQQLGSRAKEFANTRGKEWATEVRETTRPAAKGFAHVLGVIFKAFFIFIAGCIVLALFGVLMALIFGGITSWPINNFLWTSNLQRLSAWGTILFFIAVPILAFITWLIRRIVNARSGKHHLGWIFGGLWLVGWICAIVFAASIAKDLRVYDKQNGTEIPITQPARGKMIIQVNEPEIRYSGSFWWMHDNDNTGWDITDDTMRYNNVKIRYNKSDDSSYHVRVYKYSAGSTFKRCTKSHCRKNGIQYKLPRQYFKYRKWFGN